MAILKGKKNMCVRLFSFFFFLRKSKKNASLLAPVVKTTADVALMFAGRKTGALKQFCYLPHLLLLYT